MSSPDLQQILETSRPVILRRMRRFVGPDEAEDLAQVAMLKLADGLSHFRGDSALSTWIHRIATNVALDYLRSRGARAGSAPVVPSATVEAAASGCVGGLVSVDDQAASVETTLVRGEMNECIRQFVAELPARYRAVMVLREVEGLTSEETAQALGLGVEAVKMRLHRARARLKNTMAAHCEIYRDDRNEIACDRRHDTPRPRRATARP